MTTTSMLLRDLAILKRRNVLPLRGTLWMYQFLCRKKRMNKCCDVPYWLSIIPTLLLTLILFLTAVIEHGSGLSIPTMRILGSVSLIILMQLIASEGVNRKVIHTFSRQITPPVSDKFLWRRIDAPMSHQILIPALAVAIGSPLMVMYAAEVFPEVKMDSCFILGVGIVVFNSSYGMFMHISSSMSLVAMSSSFSNRLYEFFPTGSPVIRHLANLYSSALLITIITSIVTVTVVVLTFPSSVMFKLGVISMISAIVVAIMAFFVHLHSISMLIEAGKDKAIAKIQLRINSIRASAERDDNNRGALEEIGNLIDISEKIHNARPKIISFDIGFKYVISIVSPVLPLGNKDYLAAIQALLDSVKGSF